MELMAIILLMAAMGVYILSVTRDQGGFDLRVLAILLAIGSIVSAILGEQTDSEYVTIVMILINFYIVAGSLVSFGGKERWRRRIPCRCSEGPEARRRGSAIRL